MDKLQTIVVVLLIVAIIFSVTSVAMNIYLSNLNPVSARAVNSQESENSNGGLTVEIVPPVSGEEKP